MSSDPPTPTPGPERLHALPSAALASAGLTDAGREREENEDAFGEFPGARLFIVADGMGGRAAGGVAAQVAIAEIERFFREQQAAPRRPWPFPMDRALSFGTNLLAVGFKVANQRIRETAASKPEYHRMGATAAALALGETQVVVAHVGDVRVYRLRAGALTPLTRDHSVVEEVRAARPEMTDAELGAIANRNVITRALGTRQEVEATVTSHPHGARRPLPSVQRRPVVHGRAQPPGAAAGRGPGSGRHRAQPDRRRQRSGWPGQHHRLAGAGVMTGVVRALRSRC